MIAPPLGYRRILRRQRNAYTEDDLRALAKWLMAHGWVPRGRGARHEQRYGLDAYDDWPLTLADAAREQAARNLGHILGDRYTLAVGATSAESGAWVIVNKVRVRTDAKTRTGRPRGRRMTIQEALKLEGIE